MAKLLLASYELKAVLPSLLTSKLLQSGHIWVINAVLLKIVLTVSTGLNALIWYQVSGRLDICVIKVSVYSQDNVTVFIPSLSLSARSVLLFHQSQFPPSASPITLQNVKKRERKKRDTFVSEKQTASSFISKLARAHLRVEGYMHPSRQRCEPAPPLSWWKALASDRGTPKHKSSSLSKKGSWN